MERLGMLRGVRMASVGAFVLIRHMLRLICGRRFALITVAMAIVVAYQLTDDLFISYGTVGADSLLGVDLPPLFMAAMTMGGSEQNFIINEGASLDVSGTLNNINDVLLTGNVVNNGTIDLISANTSMYVVVISPITS